MHVVPTWTLSVRFPSVGCSGRKLGEMLPTLRWGTGTVSFLWCGMVPGEPETFPLLGEASSPPCPSAAARREAAREQDPSSCGRGSSPTAPGGSGAGAGRAPAAVPAPGAGSGAACGRQVSRGVCRSRLRRLCRTTFWGGLLAGGMWLSHASLCINVPLKAPKV